ncbi:class II aldolase/adducin family protein [Embleya sp. NPDC059237]|uniref:class II aldolase/adducin family protein n=1 Tax=Embleya sp. NPDC059237 TaxID=3346784 RepID=UPI0036B367EA
MLFPACHGIAHAHPPHALAFASLGETIPSVTNQLDTLGEIPCVAADDHAIKRRVANGHTAMPMIPGVAQSPGPYVVNMELIPQVLAHLTPRAGELDRPGLGFTIHRHGAMTIGRTLHEAANNLHRIESGAQAAILQATLLGGLSHVRTNPLFASDHTPEDARASAWIGSCRHWAYSPDHNGGIPPVEANNTSTAAQTMAADRHLYGITGGQPLKGAVQVAGAKNSATKLLVATLLTTEPCVLSRVPRIVEVQIVLDMLAELGTHVEWLDEHICASPPPPSSTLPCPRRTAASTASPSS